MIIINFSHRFTPEQLEQIQNLTHQKVDQVIDLPVQFDNSQPFLPQVQALLSKLELSSEDLQTQPILINPPAYNFITALLLAELHGRMGYFPAILRIRPVESGALTTYEVAEIINLQKIREEARKQRGKPS